MAEKITPDIGLTGMLTVLGPNCNCVVCGNVVMTIITVLVRVVSVCDYQEKLLSLDHHMADFKQTLRHRTPVPDIRN